MLSNAFCAVLDSIGRVVHCYAARTVPQRCLNTANPLHFLTLLRFRHHAGELVSTEALSKTHRQTQQVHFWIGIDLNYSFWDCGVKRMVRFFADRFFLTPGPQLAARGKPSTMVTARVASRDENHWAWQTARWYEPARRSDTAPNIPDSFDDARFA